MSSDEGVGLSENFDAIYKGLENERKWALSSGKKVEDVIYKHGSTLRHEK